MMPTDLWFEEAARVIDELAPHVAYIRTTNHESVPDGTAVFMDGSQARVRDVLAQPARIGGYQGA